MKASGAYQMMTTTTIMLLLRDERLNTRHLSMTRKINFYRRCFMSDNDVLRTVFVSSDEWL